MSLGFKQNDPTLTVLQLANRSKRMFHKPRDGADLVRLRKCIEENNRLESMCLVSEFPEAVVVEGGASFVKGVFDAARSFTCSILTTAPCPEGGTSS